LATLPIVFVSGSIFCRLAKLLDCEVQRGLLKRTLKLASFRFYSIILKIGVVPKRADICTIDALSINTNKDTLYSLEAFLKSFALCPLHQILMYCSHPYCHVNNIFLFDDTGLCS